MTAAFSALGSRLDGFIGFLRRELAPSPGRWQATLRITLACVVVTVPLMVFHLKEPLLIMILMFLIVKEDTTTTLLGTVLGMIGVTIGCALLLGYYLAVVDLAWMRVIAIPVVIALGLYVNRIITLGPLGSSISFPLSLGMVIPDISPSAEFLNRVPFYLWWSALLGLSVNLAVQFLLNPETCRSVLIRGLTQSIKSAEDLLRGSARGEPLDPWRSSLLPAAEAGTGGQLKLLKMGGSVEPWLKEHHAELVGQIILVDRLVMAVAVLEVHPAVVPDEATRRRLLRVANVCARWREAIKDLGPLELPAAEATGRRLAAGPSPLPSVGELERVVELVPLAFSGGNLPAELQPTATGSGGGLIVADARTNPDYWQSAIKGALAAMICYLIFTLAAYPAIYTSVITCMVCSLSTVGASVQKGSLRFAGAVVGGGLGLVTLVWIFPHLDSLGGFWFPFAAVTGLAAYVNRGGPGLSYCGYQIGLAFYKCVLQSYGPYTELRVVRDRMIGIALGLAVFWLIDSRLWPVLAHQNAPTKLAEIMRLLAGLAGLPDDGAPTSAAAGAEARGLRARLGQEFSAGRQLVESSRFEASAARPAQLQVLHEQCQVLFIYLLAMIQHRPDLRPEDTPEPLRAVSARFRASVAEMLRDLAARMEGRAFSNHHDLRRVLADCESAVELHRHELGDAEFATHIRVRLELYRQIVAAIAELAGMVETWSAEALTNNPELSGQAAPATS